MCTKCKTCMHGVREIWPPSCMGRVVWGELGKGGRLYVHISRIGGDEGRYCGTSCGGER